MFYLIDFLCNSFYVVYVLKIIILIRDPRLPTVKAVHETKKAIRTPEKSNDSKWLYLENDTPLSKASKIRLKHNKKMKNESI